MNNTCLFKSLIELHYHKLTSIVNYRAFTYRLNKEDLLSMVNYKIGKAIENNNFIAESDEQFWGYIHILIGNCARDIKRRQRAETEDIYEINNAEVANLSYRSDYDMKEFSKYVSLHLVKRLNKREKMIFKPFFIDGLKYEEVAKETGMKLGTVKNNIFNVRKKANALFGEHYRNLVA